MQTWKSNVAQNIKELNIKERSERGGEESGEGGGSRTSRASLVLFVCLFFSPVRTRRTKEF